VEMREVEEGEREGVKVRESRDKDMGEEKKE